MLYGISTNREVHIMKGKNFIFLASLLCLVLAAGILSAQSVPQLINYQGRLTDPGGAPLVDGSTVDLTFSFYGADTGGTVYLSVLQEDVEINKGLYNVMVGSGTITPGTDSTLSAVFKNHQNVWMGVKVDSDAEMIPRNRITSVPFALEAEHARTSDPQASVESIENLLETSGYDQDDDGHKSVLVGGDDCKDNDASVFPGAPELCDGKDNQCQGDAGNGYIDEGCTVGDSWPENVYMGPCESCDSQIVIYKNKYAFILDNSLYRYNIFNISDPGSPVNIGTCCYAGSEAVNSTYLKGDYIFQTTLHNKLTWEISVLGANTVSATQAYWYNGSSEIQKVILDDYYAYYISESRVYKYNIDDPANPYAKSNCLLPTSPSPPFIFAMDGDYLYTSNASGIHRTNLHTCVSDETTPSFTDCVWPDVYDAQVRGKNAYLAANCDNSSNPGVYAGLVVTDVWPPHNIPVHFVYEVVTQGQAIEIENDYIYMTDDATNFYIFKNNFPGAPTLIADPITLNNTGKAIAISGNHAYIVEDGILEVIQIMK
jgi:hypothetical protein